MKRSAVFLAFALCSLATAPVLIAAPQPRAADPGQAVVAVFKTLQGISGVVKKAYTPAGPVEKMISEMRSESMAAKTPDEGDSVMKKYQSKGEELRKTLSNDDDRLSLDRFLWSLAINLGDDARLEALIDRQTTTTQDEMLLMTGEFSRQRGKTLSPALNDRLQKLAAADRGGATERAKRLLTATPMPTEGKPFPAFDAGLKTIDDQPLTLERFKGKILLIDCWATWCPPCRNEIPGLVEAYKKYQPKGFEIVGISFDQEKDKLTAFTQEKGMTWPQYFDGKGWENLIGQNLGIQSIPAMFLLDREGNLISRDLRGPKLEAKLAELFAETK